MKRDYPYYPVFWETDPHATRLMPTAHWNSHIQDWGFMNFTRHGSYVMELDEATVWNQPITSCLTYTLQFSQNGSAWFNANTPGRPWTNTGGTVSIANYPAAGGGYVSRRLVPMAVPLSGGVDTLLARVVVTEN